MTHTSAPTKSTSGPPAAAHTRQSAPNGLGQPVGALEGDRTCAQCGFNLIGQRICKEPNYQLFVVRCPECGQVAAVEEHPRTARWAPRLTMLVAAGWLLVVALVTLGSGGVIGALSITAADTVNQRFSTHVYDLYAASPAGREKAVQLHRDRVPVWSFDATWWADQNHAAMFRAWGGEREVFWRAGPALGLLPIVSFFVGIIMSVILLHRARRELPIVSLIPISFAGVIVLISYTMIRTSVRVQPALFNTTSLFVFWRVVAPALAVSWMALVAGSLAGRSITRTLIRALLPPRLRNSLSVLWSADGMDPAAVHGATGKRLRRT